MSIVRLMHFIAPIAHWNQREDSIEISQSSYTSTYKSFLIDNYERMTLAS